MLRPGIVGTRGFTVYGHTTTAMHEIKYISRVEYILSPPYRLGWQRHCQTCRSLHELDNQGTVFFFSGWLLPTAGRRVRSFVLGKEYILRTRGIIVSRSAHGKVPTRQLHNTPIAVSGSGYTGN